MTRVMSMVKNSKVKRVWMSSFPKCPNKHHAGKAAWRQAVFHLLPLRLWCWCEKQPPGRLMGLWGPGSAPLGFGGENSMPPVFQQISREQMARIFGNRRPRSRCSHSRSHSPLGSRYYRSHSPHCSPAGSHRCPSSNLGRRCWRSSSSWCLGWAAWRAGNEFPLYDGNAPMLLLLYMPWLGDAVKNTRRHFHSWHQFAN